MNKSKQVKVEILDCTIRDGGYVNNWNFDKKIVREIYRTISRTGVDIIELGFRNNEKKETGGPWLNVSEDLLNETISGISGIPVALMIDYNKADARSIPSAGKSLVKMYRVACNKDKTLEAINFCEDIKEKGYIVSIQLMGIINSSEASLDALLKPLSRSSLDYIYFADSYGSLFPQTIARYVNILKGTGKKIGFHAHNSLQLAFANTLEALNNGVDIVDATIFGMGRGAGNLPLETLVAYFEKTLNNKKYNTIPILHLIDRYFTQLHKDSQWGYSLPYMLSGILEIHPNYAKEMIDYREYDINDVVKVLEAIKKLSPVGFKGDIVKQVLQRGFVSFSREAEDFAYEPREIDDIKKLHRVTYNGRHEGKDFLILANGPSVKKYKQEIGEFIRRYDPVVMGANYMSGLPCPDYHAFSNKKRFVSYFDQINKNSKILLSSGFEEDFVREYVKRDFEWIVHLNRTSSHFDICDDIITSDCRTISILLIGVAIVMGAKRIFIAGMDGYRNIDNFLPDNIHFYSEKEEVEDPKLLMEKHHWNERMLKNINSFLVKQGKEELHILTPTSHTFFYNSIHNWIK